ncbi:Uncharacterized protein containing caspase domain [Burkholderia pseudomallei]|uniref:caspase family protein n=1 Tax=Burkholderia pseudomallei TaxID=28450 RepID=UPI0009786455|nr:caspase family protein [Burkholderia pseudomallei]MBF3568985.1 caspase family protein [Burkholderia pseudomallei]OMS41600.1 hypothetical protein AQ742_07895 [Burkholderia pseudomallei]CAJ3342984.1 Uncharacterized protein containing caspase domain [Burkholderia pseudomallei]CAJ4245675.1 Uncharacterized protein containing caspase domain [Burkholderia pseudomallei]CAJ6838686.1 Uncharacterized protein containing caspase domain [Burkholderia pseudomallei]
MIALLGAQPAKSDTPTLYAQQGPLETSALAVSGDGRILASADSDGVRLYDLGLLQESRTLDHKIVRAVALSPDGRFVASAGTDLPGSAGAFSVKIWRTADGLLMRRLVAKSQDTALGAEAMAVAFSPDGTTLAASCDDRTIHLWDFQHDSSERVFKTSVASRAIEFSADGSTLIEGGGDGVVRLWDVKTGVVRMSLKGHTKAVTSIALTHGGTVLGSGSYDGTIRIWNMADGSTVRTIRAGESVGSISFGRGGDAVFDAWTNTVHGWQVSTGKPIAQYGPFFLNVVCIVGSFDGKRLVAAVGTNDTLVLDLETGAVIRKFSRSISTVSAISFWPEKHALLADEGTDVRVWNYDTGELLGTVNGNYAASPLGPLGVLSPDKKLTAVKGIGVIGLIDTASGKTLASLQPANFPFATALAFSPDGSLLASGGAMDANIILWDVNRRTKIREIKTATSALIWALSFSQDGKTLVSSENFLNAEGASEIALWNVASGAKLGSVKRDGNTTRVLALNRSGTLLAAGQTDGVIRLWKVSAEGVTASVATLSGHSSAVSALVFDPSREWLLSGSDGGEIAVWDMKTYQNLVTLFATGQRDWLVVAPNGLFDGTANAMQQVGWRFGSAFNIFPVGSFYNDFFFPGLFEELVRGNRPKPSIDLAEALQLPGLRAMLDQKLARVQKAGNGMRLCFMDRPAAIPGMYEDAQPMSFDASRVVSDASDPACPYQYPIRSDAQFEFVNTMTASPDSAVPTAEPAGEGSVGNSVLHVQTIAIDNYDFSKTGLRRLANSVSSAKAVQEFFIAQKAKSLTPFKDIRVWDGLFDEDATLDAIRHRLADLDSQVGRDDVVLLFLSGHGVVPAAQEMFYFAPFDVRGPDPALQARTGLDTAMIVDALRYMRARRVILVVDSCQSGGAIESLDKIARLKAQIDDAVSARTSNAAPKDSAGAGIYVIAAATPLADAIQPARGNRDALTEALLRSLAAGDAPVSARDLLKRVRDYLPSVSKQMGGTAMTPMTAAVGANFPLTGK